jgi:hypothetical protein
MIWIKWSSTKCRFSLLFRLQGGQPGKIMALETIERGLSQRP